MAYLDELLGQTEKSIIALRSMNKHSRETIGNSRFGATADAIDALYSAVKMLREEVGTMGARAERNGSPGLGTALPGEETPAPAVSPYLLLQEAVGQWAVETFPEATEGRVVRHLAREVGELAAALLPPDMTPNGIATAGETLAEDIRNTFLRAARARRPEDAPNPAEESADCLGLLFHIAHRKEFNLGAETERKLRVNRGRSWPAGVPGDGAPREHRR